MVASQDQSGGRITVLDRADGSERWWTHVTGVLGVGVEAGHALATVDTPTGSGVRAYDIDDGEVRWTVAGVAFSTQPPSASNGTVVVARSGGLGLAGLDVVTGEERWQRPGESIPLLLGVNGDLVLTGGPHPTEQRMVHLTSGEEAWPVPSGTMLATIRPHGVLLQGPLVPGGPGTRASGTVTLHDLDGTPIGPVLELPSENSQIRPPSVVGPDHRVYHGRGCPNRA